MKRKTISPRVRIVQLGAAGFIAVFVFVCPGVPASRSVAAAAVPSFVESDLWLRPSEGDAPALGQAAAELAAGHAKEALPVFARAVDDADLGGYARLYRGRAELALDRPRDAEATARQLISAPAKGALTDAAWSLLADAAEQANDWAEAVRALQTLTGGRTPALPPAYLRLGRAALKLNNASLARDAFEKIYYDYPLSAEAADAETELKTFAVRVDPALAPRERARAELLFAGKHYTDARKAFAAVLPKLTGTDVPAIELRLAECDYDLAHYAAAYDALQKYLDRRTERRDEAAYFSVSALRGLKRQAEYVAAAHRFVDEQTASPYAETVLNDLATAYILDDDDASAAEVFSEMVRRFPRGAFAERAVWKSGWWAYKNGDYPETVRLFDVGLATFARSDYRPAWMYWSARANGKLGRLEAALSGYQLTMASYRNSYYGREAAREAAAIPASRPRPAAIPAAMVSAHAPALALTPGRVPSNAPLVRALLIAGLYDDVVAELRLVQKEEGTSPFIEATIAYALNRKGDLRGGVNMMRRAYPQFMAEGGEELPSSLLKVIFPLDYWELIQRQAKTWNLDPYLTAALVAQESTFQADIRSGANAWGLMQILPSTGRRYAPFLGLGRFTTARLTDPDVNVRIGTAYFADLMKQFGDAAFALAAYNAGENRVERWRAERPGVDRDEFIDDIPFPETQNYVKRIIGTAEDYRALYGPGARVGVGSLIR